MSEWETHTDGSIVYAPLISAEGAPMAGILCALRIEFARTPGQLADGAEHLQLAMTPAQARLLSSILIEISEKIEGPHAEHHH